jgi:hypothetical protein
MIGDGAVIFAQFAFEREGDGGRQNAGVPRNQVGGGCQRDRDFLEEVERGELHIGIVEAEERDRQR